MCGRRAHSALDFGVFVLKYCLDSWFVKLCNKNKIYDLKEYRFQYEINNKSVSKFELGKKCEHSLRRLFHFSRHTLLVVSR